MKKLRKTLAVSSLKANEGQLDWLPKNPREWGKADVELTAKSIAEDPDFLEDRPLLVVPAADAFVVFAGNLRREGAVADKLAEVPCIIYTPENDEDRQTIRRRAMKDGRAVELTVKEFDLIEFLMRNPGRVYSRETLLDLVWGYDYQGDTRTVDVHIRRLREKLELDPARPEYIITKWGVGYYFAD